MQRRERSPLLIVAIAVILFCVGMYLTTTDLGRDDRTPNPVIRIEVAATPTP